MNAIQMTHIDQMRIKLKSRGVNSLRKYDLPKQRKCAACDKPILPGSLVYHNKGYSQFIHYYATDCVIDHDLTPDQQAYMAMVTGGKRKVERVEQRLATPNEINPNGRRPAPVPTWQNGICTVTPDGQVILPTQWSGHAADCPPVPLLPATTPIRVSVEIAPDTRPLLATINETWLQHHGLVIPVTVTTVQSFRVVSRPLSPGSPVITHDVIDGRERIVQSSPRLDIAQRVAAYHNSHVT